MSQSNGKPYHARATESSRRPVRPLGRMFAIGTVLALSTTLFAGVALNSAQSSSPIFTEGERAAVASLKSTGEAFAAVSRNVSPAVVSVTAEKEQPALQNFRGQLPGNHEDLLKRFFGDRFEWNTPENMPRRSMGQGSGFIVSEDGYILTNHHVARDADNVKVVLRDDREFDAKIVGSDPESDLAVLKIDGKNLPFVALGDSDDVTVGEWVLAIGNPFGLSDTVTAGIVSAKGRSSVGITDFEDFIQTDAAINPGNSGGPLVNLDGHVVGINTAIISRSGGNMGIGFAIPINMAKNIFDQLVTNGSVKRGYLGIGIQEMTSELSKTFDFDGNDGILVGDVSSVSPAAKAGLMAGDVIVELDGKRVDDIGEFRNWIVAIEPSEKVKLKVWREGENHHLTVAVGERPVSESLADSSTLDLGMTVQPLTDDLREKYNHADDNGVIVSSVEPGSAAYLVGLRPGAIVLEVNRSAVSDIGEFNEAVKAISDDDSVLLLVKENGRTRFVAIRR